jgi:hypothetical protein
VVLPEGVHDAVRVEAARRKLTIAATVAALVGEVVAGPLADGVPPVREFEVKPRVVVRGEFERASRLPVDEFDPRIQARAVLAREEPSPRTHEWKPPAGLSKAEQAKRGKK